MADTNIDKVTANDPRVLQNVPIFRALPEAEIREILQASDCFIKDYPIKSLVIREGEIGESMFVILKGSVEVLLRKENSHRTGVAATLYKGDFFGEEALLPWRDGRRNGTIRVIEPCSLLVVHKRHVLHGLQKGIQELCASKVYGSDLSNLSTLNIADRTTIQTQTQPKNITVTAPTIPGMLQASGIFKSLSKQESENYRKWSNVELFEAGHYIVREGDPGRCLYLLLSGTVAVLYTDKNDKLHMLTTLEPGKYFGEQALLPIGNGKANAYVRTETDCKILTIEKKVFNVLLRRDRKLFDKLIKRGKLQLQALQKMVAV